MEQLGDNISYDDNFLGDVSRILTSYYILGMDTSGVLLEDNNKEVLTEMINLYSNLECDSNPLEIIPKKIDINTLIDTANSILVSIFPSFKDKVLDYDQLLCFYQDFYFSESSYLYTVTDDGIVIPKSIDLSDNMIEYSISVVNHEKIHALLLDSIKLKSFPGIYFELLSVLIQKITNQLLVDNFRFYNANIIDNVVRTVDCQNHISILDNLRKIDIKNESISNQTIYSYLYLKANQYLLADWYSEVLVDYYLDDNNRFNQKLNELFTNRITINDFLNYYSMTLQHENLVPFTVDRLEKVKKYSIIL